jgi:hypothetical protein
VPRRRPRGSRVIRTMKVDTGRGASVLTGGAWRAAVNPA